MRLAPTIVTVLLIISGCIVLIDNEGYGLAPVQNSTDYHPATILINTSFPNGTPLAGAQVKIAYSSGSGTYLYDTSDQNGETDFLLGHEFWGYRSIVVSEISLGSVHKQVIFVEPDGHYVYNITIQPKLPTVNKVHGKILEFGSEEPLEGMEVRVRGYDAMHNYWDEIDHTDGSGSYEVSVPNSTGSYSIHVSGSLDHQYQQVNFDLREEVNDYEIDLYLTNITISEHSLSILYKDAITEDPLLTGYISVSSEYSELSHERNSITHYPDLNGYFNFTIPEGDHVLSYNSHPQPMNVSYYMTNYIMVNDTDTNMEIPILKPELQEMSIEVWNETSPLSNSYISWEKYTNTPNGLQRIVGQRSTDHTGLVNIGMIPGEETVLKFEKGGYDRKEIKVKYEPTRSSSSINVTLEKIDYFTPIKAETKITVIDQSTGIPVPSASFEGYGSYQGNEVSIYGTTNDTGIYVNDLSVGTYEKIEAMSTLGTGSVNAISITDSGPNDITIYITDRPVSPYDIEEYYFTAKDGSGTPIAGESFNIMMRHIFQGTMGAVSDVNGIVRFQIYPGDYIVSGNTRVASSEYRWAVLNNEHTLAPGGGDLGTITVIPAISTDTISGVVMDEDSGVTIPNVKVRAGSYRILGNGGAEYPFTESDQIRFIKDTEGGSNADGFYRVYGRETVYLTATMEGYFPEIVKVEAGTRAAIEKDILMEKLLPMDLWLNGTVVDDDGSPVPMVAVMVYDIDRPSEEPMMYDETMDGTFSIQVYPGNFLIRYMNNTLQGEANLTITVENVEGLELVLAPETVIGGIVSDWSGAPLEGQRVTLEKVGDANFTKQVTMTDEIGEFEFDGLRRGTYIVQVDGLWEYNPYRNEEVMTTGWNEIYLDIMLVNLTHAHLRGTVIGEEEEGPFKGAPIPDATVLLYPSSGDESNYTAVSTNKEGRFHFPHVELGLTYNLTVQPPIYSIDSENITGGGYDETTIQFEVINENLSSGSLELENIMLDFIDRSEPGVFVNITYHTPNGSNIPVDMPIMIVFSEPMNTYQVEFWFMIEPAITNISFEWVMGDTIVIISHDPFSPNTTYFVTIGELIHSQAGNWLKRYENVTWNFTTGEEDLDWFLYQVVTDIFDDKWVEFSGVGMEGIDIYVIIDGIGGFALNEVSPGAYSVMINGSLLDWNMTYSYYFSDSVDGDDLAPHLAGEFKTPVDGTIGDDDVIDDDVIDDDTTDDDTDDDDDTSISSNNGYIFACCLIMIILILILILIIVVVKKNKGRSSDLDEE